MNIRLAEKVDRKMWDGYVAQHPDSSPYHLFAWKSAVEQAYGWKGYYLLAENEGEICGVLPLVKMSTPLCAWQLVALPYCDVGSVLSDTQEMEECLVGEAVMFAKKIRAQVIDLRGGLSPKTVSSIEFPMGTITNKVRMFLELPDSSEGLLRGFKSKLRSQIRKAEKNDLAFVWSSDGDVDGFYKVFSENMRDLGSPVHSKELIEAVMLSFGDSARLGLVFCGEQLVGGGVLLCCGQKVCIPWASTLRKYNKLAPNMLLYWNLLKFAADKGFKVFDFGRSTMGEGTYKFKAQWGAKPKELSWYTIMLNGDIAFEQEEIGGVRQKAQTLWCKLPLGVANYLGPKIRKFISL